MLAFLDHWLGQLPVSEEVKRTLLASAQLSNTSPAEWPAGN
jgi:hypothetical protein